jgi:hypothetical protein
MLGGVSVASDEKGEIGTDAPEERREAQDAGRSWGVLGHVW